ncbi:MAG: hypothetical protein JNK79_04535 [Chitinophagaceae bacterium]|nr:hypothetical protein [Chitinophagaceae bacterium]
MKYFTLLLLLYTYTLCAQNKRENFSIDPSEQTVPGSLYNSIEFKDLRRDTTYLGVVQVGLMNAKARVVAKNPLQEQFNVLMASLAGSDAKQGKLLLTFRRFTFMERTTATKETGFFFVRADLYESNNDEYRWISTLDTIVQFNAMDVTQKLLRKGENLITSFLKENLTKTPSSPRAYSLHETSRIDSIQKSDLAVYTTTQFTPGLYPTYESFRDQKPTITDFRTEEKKNSLKAVFIPVNETGGLKKIDPDDYYAVVHNNTTYVATKAGYYPLEKIGEDFYYTGIIKSFRAGTAMMFGLLTAVIIGPKKDPTQFRMDHINGSFLYNGRVKDDDD